MATLKDDSSLSQEWDSEDSDSNDSNSSDLAASSDDDDELLEDLLVTNNVDLDQAKAYNPEDPEIIYACVHELVENHADTTPDAPAICAWDAELTYSELNNAATRLAEYLIDKADVHTGDLVHVCFEKSAWFFVAMLAVNKAGAAWVPLDPGHPPQRHKQIISQTGASLALVSPSQAAKCASYVADVIEVTSTLDETLKQTPIRNNLPKVSPDLPTYVLFTSGSTGTPKGLVMQHRAVCTSQTAISKRLRTTPNVRMLQFASYVFDLCIGEIVGPLISGACLCVPSEEARLSGLCEFIRDTRVNWAFMTPSFARTISPADIPNLELLLLAGEAVPRDVFDAWFGKVRLVNGWGPAETCVFSTLHEWESEDESPLTVGQPVGGFCWIVDPDNHDRLAPMGMLGEVMIQGPTILQEYLSDPVKTEAAVISSLPQWAPRRDKPTWNRFFKSGDLCSYNSNGTIEFSSRKDTQIKIRGLRVELGEVEHHVMTAVEGVKQVVVDVFQGTAGSSLVAFLCFNDEMRTYSGTTESDAESLLLPLSPELKNTLAAAAGHLSVALPSYMVPGIFLPCRYMLSITSTKIDRSGLHRIAANLGRDAVATYSLVEVDKRPPETPMEKRMQQLWSTVLSIPEESIGRDDNFLRIGGDSITAIRLVTLSRKAGIEITVQDVFNDPRLHAVAARAVEGVATQDYEVQPFDMLPHQTAKDIKASIQETCGLSSEDDIKDVYPCTGLQEGLMALAVKQPGSYIAKYVYRLPESLDVDHFKDSWAQTVDFCDNLRTRIIVHDGVTFQALVKTPIAWEPSEGLSLQSVMDNAKSIKMEYGTRLSRYAFVDEGSKGRYFVLILHHAIFDGWSLNILLGTLLNSYSKVQIQALQPYAGFIKYITDIDTPIASNYWRSQLEGAQRASFPPTDYKSQQTPGESRIIKTAIPFTDSSDNSITKATILRAAWAIVLGRYGDTDDVCFGTTISGRQAPVPGLDQMAGPGVATIPVRIRMDKEQPVSSFLGQVQKQAVEMIPYEQFGLGKIIKLSADIKDACDFSSLFVIQPAQHMQSSKSSSSDRSASLLDPADDEYTAEAALEGYFTYPLVIQGYIHDDRVELVLIYQPSLLSVHRVEALSQHFKLVVHHLETLGDEPLNSLTIAGDYDLQRSIVYNPEEPEIETTCVHDLVKAQAQLRPNAPAICAWDAELSYLELDEASTRLALHLVKEAGVSVGDLVHVCFEKSAWFFVAMLAINKAGAAWVPLDPGHPRQRHQQIVTQTGASVALLSPSQASKCSGLVSTVIEVTETLDQVLSKSTTPEDLPNVSPSQAAYVLFTSGSTGTPKGLVMQHSAVCTSQRAISKRLRTTPGVRMLQFAAYVFDLCIGEIIGPLISGACLCVPSEEARLSGLREFIRDTKVNWAFMTPSFARTITPAEVPSLELLLLAGEAVPRDVFDVWFGKVRLVNGWGPAETCVFSTLHEWEAPDESPLTVGRPVGGFCWIVDPDNTDRLAPTGCIGEVVIQGPTLLREYLSDPVKTAAAMVTSLPEWAPRRSEPMWGRFFKSGDLCSYNPDGTIEFASRKDTQIKIRGLRVELGEVEHHMRIAVDGVRQVVVDVFQGAAGSSLVAFLSFSDEMRPSSGAAGPEGQNSIILPVTQDLKTKLSAAAGSLSVTLPSYMVPTIFIPCRYMPSITSTKVDRGSLRHIVTTLDHDALAAYSLVDTDKRAPETPMEHRMQGLWSTVLNIPAESIGRDDSFLRIGGDSIVAIRLVTVAREAGVSVTVKDIFDDPRLSAVAAKAGEGTHTQSYEVDKFGLIPVSDLGGIKSTIRDICVLTDGQTIEDVYPSSSFQEGLMALSVKQPGSYIAKYVYRLPSHVDINKFKVAWEKTLLVCSNLRTRIVRRDGATFQAVINEDLQWEETGGHDLRSSLNAANAIKMQYGTPLCRYSTISPSESDNKYFVLIIHHAIFDGWSLNLVLGTLRGLYFNEEPFHPLPYSTFINYQANLDKEAATQYWRDHLDGAQQASFPKSTKASADSISRVTKKTVPISSTRPSITIATVLRAAWAIVLARYCDTDDVCFGTTISGRNAPLPGIEMVTGPSLATVPVRVQLNGQQNISDFLNGIQRQASDMIIHEQFGLQNISKVSADAKAACNFSNLLIIQPMQHTTETEDEANSVLLGVDSEVMGIEDIVEGYFTYPLVTQGLVYDDQVELMFIYKPALVSDARIEALSHHIQHVIEQLLGQDEIRLEDVSVASSWDLEKAQAWNAVADITEVYDTVPNVISKATLHNPSKEALYSSEESLTYAEFDQISTLLGYHLTQLGVGPEKMVAICLEKSIWAVVAMLGIMKAGGAFVPLDPSHPPSRRKALVEEVGAEVTVVSPHTAALDHATDHVVELSSAFASNLSKEASSTTTITNVQPTNAAYVIFTSGSTGRPKAIVMEHHAVCTSIAGHGKSYGISDESRVLQFSNTVFDVSLCEIITTLAAGGTVCVPSDTQRLQGITSFITEASVNAAMLTPSFASTFSPEDVPTLKTLVIGGEAPTEESLRTWYGRVKVINGYGPAEACIYCATYVFQSADESPRTIGKGSNNTCWIVDADNHQRLAPVGCTGELLLHGTSLARGYANNPEVTQQSFLSSVDWLPSAPDDKRKFYKTGDLVKYNSDGTIQYLGRRDTQVKLRGQRIELASIEHSIKKALPSIEHVAVDVIRQDSREALAAFIDCTSFEVDESSKHSATFLPMTESLKDRFSTVLDELKATLPRYMVPTFYLPVYNMPFLLSMKLDRKKLRQLAHELSAEQLVAYSLSSQKKVEPTTEMEFKLREIWAEVLNVSPKIIGKNDSFLQIGGDSITAIQLVTIAQQQGLSLTISKIFEDSRLSHMAETVTSIESTEEYDVAPFELLPSDQVDTIKASIYDMCKLSAKQDIEDIYPTTAIQYTMMASTSKDPFVLSRRYVYRLSADTDIVRLKTAWETTMEHCANLRTKIVKYGKDSFQAVIKNDVFWEPTEGRSLKSVVNDFYTIGIDFASRLVRYAIVEENDQPYFVLLMHHSIFDGWSLGIMLAFLQVAYAEEELPALPPFSRFLKYASGLDREASAEYWRKQLDGVKPLSLPFATDIAGKDTGIKASHLLHRKSVPFPRTTGTSITKSTILRAAWAVLLGRYANADDVHAITTIMGRNAPVSDISKISGPIFACVPVRIRLDSNKSISHFLHEVQTQASEMIPHEQFGLENIADLSPEAKTACDFPWELIIQPLQNLSTGESSAKSIIQEYINPDDLRGGPIEGIELYPISFYVVILDDTIEINLFYNPNEISGAPVETFCEDYGDIVQKLLAQGETLLESVIASSL